MMKTGKHTKLYDLLDDAGGTASTPLKLTRRKTLAEVLDDARRTASTPLELTPPREVTPDLERDRIRRELDQIKMRRVTDARLAQIIAESELKEELAKRKLEELRHPQPKRSQQAATPSPYQAERTLALLEYVGAHPESVNTPEEFERLKEYFYKTKGSLYRQGRTD